VTLPTVCVIGAGSSGIAAAKALHRRGLEVDCYLYELRRERRRGERRAAARAVAREPA
jgi:cation diffusion facilitator CzcD-associated flavoprotein CzcO